MSKFKERYKNIQKRGKQFIFIVGFLLCVFPIAWNVITGWQQEEAITTYQKAVDYKQKSDLEMILNEAKSYNEQLYQFQGAVVDQVDLYDEDYYNKQLDCSGTGIMGSLEIPKIDVNLPIYHGTSEEALSNGVGHLKGSSLPVGGSSTHSVLSGHRGLPSSKLLLRMDEVEEGDYFFIKTCDQVLAYKVIRIAVVQPEDTSALQIKAEEDLISLVTCTPYGINTHRLIVTGARCDYSKLDQDMLQQSWPSVREIVFTLIPFFLVMFVIVMNYIDRRNLKRAKGEEVTSYGRSSDAIIGADSISTRKYRRRRKTRRDDKKRFYTDHTSRRRNRKRRC